MKGFMMIFGLWLLLLNGHLIAAEKKIFYPVLSLQSELGERYTYLPQEEALPDVDDDWQLIDSYRFKTAALKLSQKFSKVSKLDFKFAFQNKDYELKNILNNESFLYALGFNHELFPKLSADLDFVHKNKNYFQPILFSLCLGF